MLRAFLWARGARPQKYLRPNTHGYSYSSPKPFVKWVVRGGGSAPAPPLTTHLGLPISIKQIKSSLMLPVISQTMGEVFAVNLHHSNTTLAPNSAS